MARRKPKRKNRKTTSSQGVIESLVDMIESSDSRLDPIAALERMAAASGDASLNELLGSPPASANAPPRLDRASIRQTKHNEGCPEADWVGGMEYASRQIERNQVSRANKLRVSFLEVSDNEFVMHRIQEGQKNYVAGVFCNAATHMVAAVCDCPASEALCVHACASAEFVLQEMQKHDSEVRKKIIEKLALVEDRSSLPGEQTLSQLDELLDLTKKDKEEPFNISFSGERVLWRITCNDDFIDLTPVVQKRKKRGDGWTKGRELAPDTLRSGKYQLAPIDWNVLRTMDRTYYGYELDPFHALKELVGHDAVEFRHNPVRITHKPLEFAVRWSEDQSNLSVLVEPDCDFRFLEEDGLICINKNVVTLIDYSRDLSHMVSAAVRGELSVPPSRADELLERMHKLSSKVSVQLPKEAYAKTKNVKVEPVLRLKSNKAGALRCGLRVREGSRLFPPGQGQLVRYSKAKGDLVRHTRNAASESETCAEIRDALNFPSESTISEWDWQFRKFEDSLAFLSRLGELGDQLGIEPLWDEDSVDPVNIVGSISANNVRVDVQRKKDWFGIEGGVEVGGQNFTLPELLTAMDSEPAKGFTELRPGMWAKISERLRKRLLELRDAAHANRNKLELDITAIPIVQTLQESQLDITASKEWEECVQRMNKAQKINPKPSKKFAAELRDYQLEGYRWMRRLAEWGVGACLADDMGLGKTVQTLAVLVDRAKKGPTLVIAPTSVGFNWQRETQRFAPSLSAHLYRETERADFLAKVGKGDVVICSYGLALRDAEGLAKVDWGTLVLDEAQFIKNSRSKTAQAIRTFNAEWKLALTGTPIENHLGELWSLFRSISPGVFGSWEQFRKRFASPIEKQNDDDRRKALSRLITPFILRRTKGEVLKDLPERTEINLHVDLSDAERTRYDEMRLAAVGELDQIVGLPDTNDQRFRILAILTRLRQMACHVGMVDEGWEGESAKLSLLVEKVKELKEEGHRVLIFSQFTKYLSLIRSTLEAEQISMEYLDGKTPAKTRQQRVDRFQEGNTDAFLISLKAGGTGLNLTAADYVIHMDPWWNPAVEDQATDRSHRIGQTRPVIVYRIIARGTVEDQILSLHADKRDLVSGVMEGTQKAGAMSTNELLDLIRSK